MESVIKAIDNFNFLKLVSFKDFTLWDVKRLVAERIASQFPIVSLGDYIKEENTKIRPALEPEKEHKILGVNNIDGIFDAYTQLGKEIKQPYKIMKEGFLAYNPYRINVGSIGLKTKEHQNDLISPAYVVFSCNNVLNPDFLYKLFKTDRFNKVIRDNTTGSVRQNLTIDILKTLEIPLPKPTEQEIILGEYNTKLQEVERLKAEIELLKKTYDEVFYSAFSIERPKPITKKTGLQFVPFSTLSRWDALSSNFIYTDALKSSTYNLVPLGIFAKFVSRSWNKKTHKDETFNYIELGGVNPDLGIESYSTLDKKEAPSRATQTVKEGDLIIGTTRPYLKRFAIVQEEHNAFVCSSGFSVIEPTEEVNLFFLKYYLMSCFGEEQLSNNMSGALYPAITSRSLMEDIFIPEIDIEQQNEIANQILTINEKIKDNYRKIDETKKEALTEFEAKIFKN